MCSPYGDTIELAVFVDDACTLYTSQKTFADAYNPYNDNEDGTNFVNYAEDYIKNAFSQVTSCLDGKQPSVLSFLPAQPNVTHSVLSSDLCRGVR